MPELPDVLAYVRCLRQRVVGRSLNRLMLLSPFVLRSVDPPPEAVEGRPVLQVNRLGKQVVFEFADDLAIVVHLMIAGRFRWSDRIAARTPGRIGLAAFCFDAGTLALVESSTKKRAAIHIVRGPENLARFDRGGLDVRACATATFAARLRSSNHTLKRALTDPLLFDGIGNAYSDEILHAARLSPLTWTSRLSDAEVGRLHEAAGRVLREWTDRLSAKFRSKFPGPGQITAFRPEFAAHGKYGRPCPVCGTKIQRIRYAENETNYCPRCQTGGKVLADRSLSRLLKGDWPATVEELERLPGAG